MRSQITGLRTLVRSPKDHITVPRTQIAGRRCLFTGPRPLIRFPRCQITRPRSLIRLIRCHIRSLRLVIRVRRSSGRALRHQSGPDGPSSLDCGPTATFTASPGTTTAGVASSAEHDLRPSADPNAVLYRAAASDALQFIRMPEAIGELSKVWRACPVCDTERSEPHWAKGGLRIVRCSSCGMLFANPVEARFVTGTFYDQLATPFYLSPDKLESDYAPVRFARELRVFRQHCGGGAVLDVGCSTGAFLHAVQRRFPNEYSVLGTDVAGPALDHAERQGVAVLRENFLEHDFGSQRFQAATFWAVLEHLAEPRRFLAKAASLLEPGGHCFVLVPNMESLAVRLLGPRYRYIMDEHLNCFTAATLKQLVAREPELETVALTSTHFNPAVIWQDRRTTTERVPDAARAQLLKRTTRWKENPFAAPARWIYTGMERCLGRLFLADNLTMVLRRRGLGCCSSTTDGHG